MQRLASDNANDISKAEEGVLAYRRDGDAIEVVAPSEGSLNSTNVVRFITRDGDTGLLQITSVTDDPRGVKIRYKLMKEGLSRQSLTERAEAAAGISGVEERARVFARLATDAARAGEVELVRTSLQRITDMDGRNQAAVASARLLVRRHLRKQAIEIAKSITDIDLRDRTLSELAQ